MDFRGQKKAERLYQVLIVCFSIVGFVIGYVTQQLSYSVYCLGAGFVVSSLLVLPPWPMYRQYPLSWLKVGEEDAAAAASSNPKSNKKKHK
ncbi:VPS13D [Cordylochernes scorpioides]|uniref:Signal peptidase complex subunit 1 n=1 Tax=Cordylochernes scorpioides TaxID=51811 RepID=A0ABY6KIB4_9ARAC|nr:VPS13D [Cordylochernes scorpioides]